MVTRIGWSFCAVAWLLLIGVATVQASPGACSLATLKGTYGILEQGTVVAQLPGLPAPPFPVVLSGTATYDGAGNLSAAFTGNFNGEAMAATATGTYKVTSDCTYTDQITDSYGSTGHRTGAITGVGAFQEVDYIYTDAWLAASGTLKKTWPWRCWPATLKGTYGGAEQGTVVAQLPGFPPPPFPGVTSGTVTFDGAGNLSSTINGNFGGMAMPMTATGTYIVNADCTYSDTVTASAGIVFHHTGTITGILASHLDYIYTDPWVVTIGKLKKAWR